MTPRGTVASSPGAIAAAIVALSGVRATARPRCRSVASTASDSRSRTWTDRSSSTLVSCRSRRCRDAEVSDATTSSYRYVRGPGAGRAPRARRRAARADRDRAPRGRADSRRRPQQRSSFQHVAIIVQGHGRRAYGQLRRLGVATGVDGTAALPDGIGRRGGIEAFYFRDPDRALPGDPEFPPGKGQAKWHRPAIPSSSASITPRSWSTHRHVAGVLSGCPRVYGRRRERELRRRAGAPEQRLRRAPAITALRAAAGPGSNCSSTSRLATGAPRPLTFAPTTSAHWQTTLVDGQRWSRCCRWHGRTRGAGLAGSGRRATSRSASRAGALARDPDGTASGSSS